MSTSLQESKRIENQLKGRAGRQVGRLPQLARLLATHLKLCNSNES